MASLDWLDVLLERFARSPAELTLTTTTAPWPDTPSRIGIFFQLVSAFILLAYSLVIHPLRRSSTSSSLRWLRPIGLLQCLGLVLQACITSFSTWSLVILLQRAESKSELHILLYAASGAASLCNILSVILGQPSTARGCYHFVGSMTWTWIVSSFQTPITTVDWVFPWALAASFLIDVFHSIPGPSDKTLPSSTAETGLFGQLSYSWLTRIIEAKDALDLDQLPEYTGLTPSTTYEAAFEYARLAATPANAASSLYWRFIMRQHHRELIIATIMRLVCDLSVFAIPWQLQSLLTRPTTANVILMFCSRVVGALVGNFSGYYLRKLAVQYRSTISSALHSKTLRLGDMKPEMPVADLSTLAEVDTLVLFRSAQTFVEIWIFPIQAILCLGGLAYLLPYQAFIAIVALIAVMFPVLSLILRSMSFWIRSNMAAKDNRASLLVEVLGSIQAVKMHAWESVFARHIADRRAKELETLQSTALSTAGLVAYMQTMPSALTLAAFGVVLILHQPLTNQLVFAAIMLFTMLNATLGQLSGLASIVQSVDASAARIHSYLSLPETKITIVQGLPSDAGWSPDTPIATNDLEISWSGSTPLIQNGSLVIKPGSLAVITGPMGCGKSTFLLSLCRHFEKARSHPTHLQVAYVGQNSVMIGGSIRDNILLGRPYDAQRYAQVVQACCLDGDFERLREGDRTMVAGSSALSGGQCSRICLARAAYSRADILLLDDPLAAVDVRVSAHIIRSLLGPGGLLGRTTRIVCASDGALIRQADFVHQIANGTISAAQGSSQLLVELEESTIDVMEADEAMDLENVLPPLRKIPQVMVTEETEQEASPIETLQVRDEKLVPSVRKNPILSYMSWAKRFGWPIAISTLLLARTSSIMGTYVLKTMAAELNQAALPWDLGLFGLLSASQAILFFSFVYLLYKLCIVPAASVLHSRLASGILLRDLPFFQATPVGQILNLFTNDISRVDSSLNASIVSLTGQYVNLTLSCAVLVLAMPVSAVFVAPLLATGYFLQQTYLTKLRELRHLDAESRAPLLDYLQEADRGRVIFSTHGVQDSRAAEFRDLVERNVRALWPLSCIDLWLAVRLEILSVVLQIAALGLLLARSADPGVLGFVMTYVFQVTSTLSTIAKLSAQFEADAVSVSRIAEYSDGSDGVIDSLVPYSDQDPDQAWPHSGTVEFKGVSARHQPGLPESLQSISFTINPGEKVAVVGRTGAGKSSMVLCLLKLMDQTAGQIAIDSVDIADVSATRLRRSLALMPQAQVVFSGSIRQNLDPLGLHSDGEILAALELCGDQGLIDKIRALQRTPSSAETSVLDFSIGSSANLSKGEMQLLLLSRAVLQKSKVLVLDEATSGMDADTESRCHDIVFDTLRKTTTLAILHRLDLTLHYDKVLVLDRGRVVSFDSPAALLASGQGPYFSMMQEDPGALARARTMFGLQ